MRTLRIAAWMFLFSVAAFGQSVTFNKDVLPILQKNCQSCHRPGQAGPMSFLNYESTRPWAKAMKAAVVSKKMMAPWIGLVLPGDFDPKKENVFTSNPD